MLIHSVNWFAFLHRFLEFSGMFPILMGEGERFVFYGCPLDKLRRIAR